MTDVPPAGSVVPAWPELALADWQETKDALHLWSQIVGKIRLGVEPPVNHWWQIPLYVSVRGLTTGLVHVRGRGLEVELDLVAHEAVFHTTDGDRRSVPLETQSTAELFGDVQIVLEDLRMEVPMLARPVELPEAIPFADDTAVRTYDPVAVNLFWHQLLQADRLLRVFRSRFVGKNSPVHFFWGAFDLATTRFGGPTAPAHPGGVPNCADWVMVEAYSHELSSCGFWPGGSEEGSFYAYAYPQPEGFSEWEVPAPAYWDGDLGEFILPYRDVRLADDPDALVLDFLQATYEAGAVGLGWDRAALEA